VETIKLTDGDAAFLLGKGGKTKAKIARVSKADLELFERDLILDPRVDASGAVSRQCRGREPCRMRGHGLVV